MRLVVFKPNCEIASLRNISLPNQLDHDFLDALPEEIKQAIITNAYEIEYPAEADVEILLNHPQFSESHHLLQVGCSNQRSG